MTGNRSEPDRGDSVLTVEGLGVQFPVQAGTVQAVDHVSFTVGRGEILGIVGESGCGKSVMARAIMRLLDDTARVTGRVLLEGDDLLQKTEREMKHIRGRRLAMVFQDPMTSLNPVMRVGAQVAEAPRIHERLDDRAARERAIQGLDQVGIPASARRANEYPHTFSGGMRQRAVIAAALSARPELVIADEPTTALDVTIQAQILDLLLDLREQTGTSLILITHDLGVVAQVCDRVAVMYAGSLVETASVGDLFRNPRHPYTRGLLASLPRLGAKETLTPIQGGPPDLSDLPSGCRFAERCAFAFERCTKRPPFFQVGSGHASACWLEEGKDDV